MFLGFFLGEGPTFIDYFGVVTVSEYFLLEVNDWKPY